MAFKVLKKSGDIQDFDKNKIINGVIKSGGSQQEAQKVADEVEKWLPSVAENEIVDHLDVYQKVMSTLKAVNSKAADSFEAYRKSKS
jgi:transcriptional regulator NrdR family protein